MRVSVRFRVIVLGLALAITGCASPPTPDVDAAKAAVDRAATERADQYAAESLKAAQDARAALDAELKTQQGKWLKSYGKTKDLAVATKAAGDKAAADAVAGKEKADAVAAKKKADAAAARARAQIAPIRVGVRSGHPENQGRQASLPRHCAVGACRWGGHDRSDKWTRRESHRREGSALNPDARSSRA